MPEGGEVSRKRPDRDRILDLYGDIMSGEASLADFAEELQALQSDALLASMHAVTKATAAFAGGEMSQEEVEEVVREQADLHPNHPLFFYLCMSSAVQRGDEKEATGYAALAMIKARREREASGEDPLQGLVGEFRELESVLAGKDEACCSVLAYLDCGGHLVRHFLVEEMVGSGFRLRPQVLELALERGEEAMPVIISMLSALLGEFDPSDIPPGFVFLLRLVGHFKTLSALPVLAKALWGCVSVPLHETVLALAKVGSRYPDEVSRDMRRIVYNPWNGEARLGALEVLGLLGESEANRLFLEEELERLGPEDEDYDDMFSFLAHALLAASREEGTGLVRSALEKHRPTLDPGTVEFMEGHLREAESTGRGRLLTDAMEEDIRDLLDVFPPAPVAERRRTLTLAREEALEEEALKSLPDLSEVEKKLRTARDDPCPCGSGRKFRSCCLDRLTEMREILLHRQRKEEGEGA